MREDNVGLRDGNSYVRKTAVMCVPKIYEITPELVDRTDAIQILKEIFLSDNNSQVVANAAQALIELSMLSKKTHLEVNSKTLDRILGCLNETFEWGQVFLLDFLTEYHSTTRAEAEL